MLCVMALEDQGVVPDQGTVLVTGASGGVGGIAVALLAGLGFSVTAVTGNREHDDYLNQLGATEIVSRVDLEKPARPLEKQRWAAAIDTVGGKVLARLLAEMQYGGTVAATGLTLGRGTVACTLENSRIVNCGGNGVIVGAADQNNPARGNTITDCRDN